MPILFPLFLALPIAVAIFCDTTTFVMLMVPYLAIALVKLSSLNNLDRFLDEQAGSERRSGVQSSRPATSSDRRAIGTSSKTSDFATP